MRKRWYQEVIVLTGTGPLDADFGPKDGIKNAASFGDHIETVAAKLGELWADPVVRQEIFDVPPDELE